MTISLPYRNNNPITQVLEMVHYNLRFIIYETRNLWSIIKCSYGVWGVLEAPPAGSGAEPQRKTNLIHFRLKI